MWGIFNCVALIVIMIALVTIFKSACKEILNLIGSYVKVYMQFPLSKARKKLKGVKKLSCLNVLIYLD